METFSFSFGRDLVREECGALSREVLAEKYREVENGQKPKELVVGAG